MRKFSLFLFSFFLGTVLFVWIGQTVGWHEIKNSFLVFTGWQGLTIFGLTLLIMMIGNWKWKEILKGEGIDISFFNLFKTFLAGFSIRFLAPIILVGAELFQGYVLKERNLIPWSKGMASVIIDRILEWTVNMLVIFFGALAFLLIIGMPSMELMIIFSGVFLFFSLLIFFFYFKALKKESIFRAFTKIFNQRTESQPLETEKEIFNFFRLKNKSMWKSFALSFLRAGVMLLRTWLLIIFLSKSIGFFSSLSVLGFTYLAIMIPIPTALGIHELIQTFVFNSLDLGLPTATAFTMIIRGAELLIAIAGIIILSRLGVILLKKALFKKLNKK